MCADATATRPLQRAGRTNERMNLGPAAAAAWSIACQTHTFALTTLGRSVRRDAFPV